MPPEPESDPFSALGDANRRAIVVLLRPGERSVKEIADQLPISRPAVSKHLRVLREAGLSRRRHVERAGCTDSMTRASKRSAPTLSGCGATPRAGFA